MTMKSHFVHLVQEPSEQNTKGGSDQFRSHFNISLVELKKISRDNPDHELRNINH